MHKVQWKEVTGLYYGKRPLLLTALGAILLGMALHFLYHIFPSAATALFSPVCESLWEHVKLVFWPYLLATLWLNRGRPGGARPWLLVLPLLCLSVLLLGFGYHILLGGTAVWVDVLLYILTMALGFWLATRFSGPFHGVVWTLPIAATVLLGVLIGLFTLWPPQGILFTDLSAAGTGYFMV